MKGLFSVVMYLATLLSVFDLEPAVLELLHKDFLQSFVKTFVKSFVNDRSLTALKQIANAFNKYFVNVTSDIRSSIRYSKKSFQDFLLSINVNYFLLNHTMKWKSKV